MKEEFEGLTIEDYNSEPVYYCEHCLSLAIKSAGYLDYCSNCGCTDIATTSIENWEEMYKVRHGGKKFSEE